MKKLIFIIILIIFSTNDAFSQQYRQVVGFKNGQNAIIKIHKGDIISDSFVLSVDVDWTDKNGLPKKQSNFGILITNDNLMISPKSCVKCLSLRDGDIYINNTKNLHFEIQRSYLGEPINITLHPVCTKNVSQRDLSPVEFSLPETLTISYPGYLDIPVYLPISDSPDLIIKNEKFTETDSNNIINALEKTFIVFEVENIGNGIAKDVMIKASLINEIKGISILKEIEIGNILPSEVKSVSIPIQSNKNISTGIAEFKIEALEQNGFDAFPLYMKIETLEFKEPDVRVVDAVFSTDDGGRIKRNYPVNLRVLIQNIGKGKGENVNLSFILPESNFLHIYDTNYYELGTLTSGQTRIIDFSLTAVRRYPNDSVPIIVDINEKFHQYATDTLVILDLQKELVSKSEVVIIPGYSPVQDEITPASLSSDVDRNIPFNDLKYPNKFALVIGNEEYTKYQRSIDNELNVVFAKNDARVFSEYLVKTLGFKKENVYLLLDATKGEMEQKIDLITKRCSLMSPESELVFYFAGHGLPDEETKEPYIIPVDVSGSNLRSGIKLSDVYNKLAETRAKRITVFLDACFSGGSREGALLAARNISIEPKSSLLNGNMIVLSASSSSQSSLPYHQKYHGMFTYYLLKGIQQNKGIISYKELFDYIKHKVSNESLRVNEKEQDPNIRTSPTIEENWQNWMLYQ